MSDENSNWSWEDIDALLTLLPVLEDPAFVPAQWQKSWKDSEGVLHMGWPVYSETAERVFALAPWVHPYDPLPEDEPGLDVREVAHTPEYLSQASANQVLRYLALCRRLERFGDGHIESQFKRGRIVAALRRLRELREAAR
ncbi:MAG TPA: DUF6508 domain-containing protein [Fimbriimonadaceae bacterium]|nr:DUF6508 domain-containing protein [Fimbriimonadaceae bacterium]